MISGNGLPIFVFHLQARDLKRFAAAMPDSWASNSGLPRRL